MLPVTHPKVLRSPNQIRNTLSAAHQICLCLHRSSLCGHAAAATCLFIQIDSGQNKRGRNLLYHHRYISLCIVTAAASPFRSLLLSTQVLLRFRGPQNISASSKTVAAFCSTTEDAGDLWSAIIQVSEITNSFEKILCSPLMCGRTCKPTSHGISIWDVWASRDLDYPEWAVWSHIWCLGCFFKL